MKRTRLIKMAIAGMMALLPLAVQAQQRAMWASVCAKPSSGDVTTNSELKGSYGKMLLSWRALPSDGYDMAYHVYSRDALSYNGMLTRLTPTKGISNATCYQLSSAPKAPRVYYLLSDDYFSDNAPIVVQTDEEKTALREAALDTLLLDERFYRDNVPYITIPLQPTQDVCDIDTICYQANDCSVGDLDGDGEMEIVVKRLLTVKDRAGNVLSDGTGGQDSQPHVRHNVVWDAYKLDGTLLWRVKSGPNIILGNSSNFAVADFDGDGRAEMVTRTNEGTVFGDGTELTDENGVAHDYRTWTGGWVDHYTSRGPDYFSVIDGTTGRELARADFIDRGNNSEAWGDDYWKRANSLRLGVVSFNGQRPQIFLGRGVYARTVVEGWDYSDGILTRLWHFDSNTAGGSDKNKDGKPNSAYAGQGNHSFCAADLDGDGRDEVMYGSCAFDDDGTGLWSTQLGHGDANHVGRFLPDREGLQVWHCLESGNTNAALHDAADGQTIWSSESTEEGDCGRCMVADIDPNSPGCEFWWYKSNAHSQNGTDLGYNPSSCNMGIWFDGSLSRQLINEGTIDSPRTYGRVFTMYRYNESFNNGSKSNPGWYGDLVGDWREEIIVPDQTKLDNLKVFSTWYPTTHKFPWLMTDHTYLLSALNQNVGYNQPNNLGWYLGTDLSDDQTAWEAFKAANPATTQGIDLVDLHEVSVNHRATYSLTGQKVGIPANGGIYIIDGKKVFVR